MTKAARSSDAGFTLIEALVAMVILGLGAVSLLSAAEGHTGRISEVTNRVAARWVAENALNAAQLGLAIDDKAIEMYGQRFDVTREVTATDDADLRAITLRVAQSGSGRQIFVLDGYAATQALP